MTAIEQQIPRTGLFTRVRYVENVGVIIALWYGRAGHFGTLVTVDEHSDP